MKPYAFTNRDGSVCYVRIKNYWQGMNTCTFGQPKLGDHTQEALYTLAHHWDIGEPLKQGFGCSMIPVYPGEDITIKYKEELNA